MRLKTTVIVFTSAILLANAIQYDLNDDEVTVEDDIDNYTEPRHGRIMWPTQKNDTESDPNSEEPREVNQRKKRLLLYSYRQSPIMDMMLQSLPHKYVPNNPSDPFDFLRDQYPLPKGYSQPLDEYDYIIIGGGTAGSVVASRLTEDKPRAMVLVLEAGKPETLLNDIPAMVSYTHQLPDAVWPYRMEKQPGVCLGSDREQCYWPRGKGLGGTSAINYMLYTRGRPQDWDRIAADGNYGWNYEEVLQYYIKSENSEVKDYKNLPYRGRNGELTVSNVPVKTGLAGTFLKAERSFGNPTVDYNSPTELGFGLTQAMMQKGHRVSAAKAFLHSHKKRRNLHILTRATVTKIIIEPQSKRAYAVEYIKNGIRRTVRSRREIILSAGPIASPQLLMLSGIGPEEHLQSLGIPVVVNLQVGRLLYDHIAFPGVIFTLNTTNASILEPKVATFQNLIQWLHYGDGLLTTAGGVEALGYLKTSASQDPENVPDIEILSMGGSLNLDSGGPLIQSWGLAKSIFDQSFEPLYGRDTWSGVIMLTQPKSSGYLELKDTNPFTHPRMQGNYLTDPQDLVAIMEAIQHVIQIGYSDAFKKYNPQLFLPDFPTCRHHAPGSDAYWECAVRTYVISLHHQIATCKMGPLTDPYAVVDPELRVYGVNGLRVIDSSVIPRPTNAHTCAPAIMIGEKGADLIKKTWNYDEVLKYYKKSEKSELKEYKNLPYRGRDGELTVSNVPFKTGLVEAFLKAERSFGNPTVDYNSPNELGFGYTQAMMQKGHRVTSAKAFLHNHKRRRNLHILTQATATKVIIEPQTKRAYAVEYVKNGMKHIVRCRREVILSAGPIASPQLLMLSGIGPEEHLKSLGIPVLVNLQVGKVLYDHIAFPGVVFRLNTTNASLLEPKVATLQNVIQWLHYGDGLLTTTGAVEALGYLKTSVSTDPENVPDIELLSMGGSLILDSGGALRESWRIAKNVFDQAFGPLYGKDTWSAVIMLTQPKSKGYLELRDTNPFSHPRMYGNYLTDPQDMAAMLEAVKHVIKVGYSDAFKKYDPQLFLADYTQCRNHVIGSDSYWDCAIRTALVTLHHQIATCRMGPQTDPYAVVDPELRVYGIDGLRVIDSSVIPRQTNAHTCAPAIMIGEKGADLIKKTWSNVVS